MLHIHIKYIASFKKKLILKYTIILREMISYWAVRKPALVKQRMNIKGAETLAVEKSCRGPKTAIEQSSLWFCNRPSNVRKTMGHVGPIHPVYMAIARCVERQLRMWSALSGHDEGGICANTFSDLRGRRRRYGQTARCQSRHVDISIPKLSFV